MKLTAAIAKKLLQLANGGQMNRSELNTLADELIGEGIVLEKIAGRSKRSLSLVSKAALDNWLFNKYGVNDLPRYIDIIQKEAATRADNIQAASNSKLSATRTFKGFLINCPSPVNISINGAPLTIHSTPGTFQFIYDFETFGIPADVLVVGVENAEVFRHAGKLQRYLMNTKAIFISRYPQQQGKDLVTWLKVIPNHYTHFGDYDLAGMNIYVQEYKKHLGDRAMFYMPDDLEELLQRYGNSSLYDQQQLNVLAKEDNELSPLIFLLHKYKKGLEQEALLW